MKKINPKGFGHHVLMIVFVLAFAGIGAATLSGIFAAKGGKGGGNSNETWCRDTTLTKRSSGECVSYVQKLANWKYAADPDLTINGIFDDETILAVKQVQKAYGFRESGKVDDKTWGVLCYSEKAPGGVEPGFDLETGNAAFYAGCSYGVGGK